MKNSLKYNASNYTMLLSTWIHFFVRSYNLHSLMSSWDIWDIYSWYISHEIYSLIYVCIYIYVCVCVCACVSVYVWYLYVYFIILQGNSWCNSLSNKKLMAWSYTMCPHYQISCSQSEIFYWTIKIN